MKQYETGACVWGIVQYRLPYQVNMRVTGCICPEHDPAGVVFVCDAQKTQWFPFPPPDTHVPLCCHVTVGVNGAIIVHIVQLSALCV